MLLLQGTSNSDQAYSAAMGGQDEAIRRAHWYLSNITHTRCLLSVSSGAARLDLRDHPQHGSGRVLCATATIVNDHPKNISDVLM